MVKCNCFGDGKSHALVMSESESPTVGTGVRCMRFMVLFNRFPYGVRVRIRASVRSDEPFDFDQQFFAAEIALEIEQVA